MFFYYLCAKQDVLLQRDVVEQWAYLVALLYKIKSKLSIICCFCQKKNKYKIMGINNPTSYTTRS